MAEWPENNEIARFPDLVEPVVDAIKQVYRLRFKGYKDLTWRGPSLPESMAAGCHQYDEKFKAHNLKYGCQDQGRSPLEEIVAAAIQLGIEQGRRYALKERSEWERASVLMAEAISQSNDHTKQEPQ